MIFMKTLLYNPPGFMREECCIGEIPVKIIPSQIFLAGAYLQKQGFDVDVVDGQTQKEEFNDYEVVVVWVALFDGFYKDIEYLKKAKELGKKTVMVLNDPIEGMEKEAMERFDFIDVAVRLNEREVTLGKVLQAVQKGVKLDFPGVMWREGKKIVDNGVSPFLPNLHHLGSCSQLLEKLPLKSYESAFIITGRGCPFQCTFCEYRQSGVRKRRIEDILSEFAVLDGKIERVFALDLNMPADKKWTNEFLEKMKESKFKVKWQTDARAGDCTIELLKKFKDAGCTNMVIGVESLDDGILEKIRKGTNVAMIKEAISNGRKAGIAPGLSFMIGFPWDSEETMKNTVKNLKEIANPSTMTRFVRPNRGTPLYDQCKEYGLLERDLTLDDYVKSRHYPIMNTLNMTKKQVYDWDYKIQKAMRVNPKYIWNFVKERGFKPRYAKRFLKLLLGEHIIQ